MLLEIQLFIPASGIILVICPLVKAVESLSPTVVFFFFFKLTHAFNLNLLKWTPKSLRLLLTYEHQNESLVLLYELMINIWLCYTCQGCWLRKISASPSGSQN